MLIESLSHEQFASRLGSHFTLSDDDMPSIDLRLIEVQPLQKHGGLPESRTPFSLLFKAASQQVFPQRLYHLRHDAMGELPIFLVPIGRDAEGVTYEAIFN